MNKNIILNLKNISKKYGEKAGLSSLSITIKKGELVALIGPSGAGKTTLLNILTSIVKPDSGNVMIDNKSIDSYKSTKELSKKIGIIRQQFDLVGQLSVINNVLAGKLGDWGTLKSIISLLSPREKNLAIDSLERVGLTDKLYKKTSTLSGGEQQRVALARLLVQNPEIILADEPVSSLDPARAEDILSILVKLVKEENQTLISSLHSTQYAKKYFDRIIGLRSGKVFFDLPTKKVTNKDLESLYSLKENI
ncbi:phosphonate ABC transporter ATP-binding protein [Dethiothermospora halolimnae]|uniref:phosphonate ABC transporter ATP-binding protein n=1 Tax=Dethiothermospora halolimnae TaxID=3114390 RepID=UPI003CCBD511